MAYSTETRPVWRKAIPGPGNLQLEYLASGRCYVRNSSNVRVARVILLDLNKEGAYISLLHVKKKHRRRGYGRRLLEAVLQMAQQMNCEGISAHVQVDNAASIALFRRVGFFIACTTQDDDPHHLMAQRLRR